MDWLLIIMIAILICLFAIYKILEKIHDILWGLENRLSKHFKTGAEMQMELDEKYGD